MKCLYFKIWLRIKLPLQHKLWDWKSRSFRFLIPWEEKYMKYCLHSHINTYKGFEREDFLALLLQLCDCSMCQLHCLSFLWHTCGADKKTPQFNPSSSTWTENIRLFPILEIHWEESAQEMPTEITFPPPINRNIFPWNQEQWLYWVSVEHGKDNEAFRGHSSFSCTHWVMNKLAFFAKGQSIFCRSHFSNSAVILVLIFQKKQDK